MTDDAVVTSDETIASMVNFVKAAEIYAESVGCSVSQGAEALLRAMQAMQKAGAIQPGLMAAASKAVM